MHRMITGASGLASSPSLRLPKPIKDHSVYVTIYDADSSITALTVALQATVSGWNVSDSNANWIDLYSYQLTAGDLSAKKAVFSVTDKLARRIRVAITTITGANASDSINVYYEGKL